MSKKSPTKLTNYDPEDLKKYEEEKKLEALSASKPNTSLSSPVKKQLSTSQQNICK